MNVKMMVVIGLGCVFVPLLIAALSTLDAQWSTVANYVTFPIIIIFFIGIIIMSMRGK